MADWQLPSTSVLVSRGRGAMASPTNPPNQRVQVKRERPEAEGVRSEADLAAVEARAAEERIPLLLVFVNRAGVAPDPPILKGLSTAFRSRALVAAVYVHPSVDGTVPVVRRFGVASYPAACVLPVPGAEPIWVEGVPTHRRLSDALRLVLPDAAPTGPDAKDEL